MAGWTGLGAGVKTLVLGGVAASAVVVGAVVWQGRDRAGPHATLPEAPAPAVPEPAVPAAEPAPEVPATPDGVATALQPPSFDVVRVEPDGATLVAGRAEAGQDVAVLVDGAEAAVTQANPQGRFVVFLTLASSDAARVMTLELRRAAGPAVPSADQVLLAPIGGDAAPAEAAAEPADPLPEAVGMPEATGLSEATGAADPQAPAVQDVAAAPAEPATAPDAPAASPVAVAGDAPETLPAPEAVAAAEPGTVPAAVAAPAPQAAPVPDAATAATPVPAADPAAPTAPQAGAVMTAGPEPATPEPPGTTSAADVSPAAVPAPVVAAIAPPPGPAPVEPAPARPAAAEPPAPAAAAPAAILLSGDTARVLQPAGDAAAVPAGTVSIDAISYTAGGEVALSGRGAAQAFVRLYLDNRPVLETAVAEDGSWGGTLPAVAPGVYTLRADQVAASGRVTSRYETPFQREDPVALAAPDPATGGSAPGPAADPAVSGAGRVSITVQPGFTLWQIARETYGDGTLYVRVYDANRSLIRDPDLIYPGQVFSVPTGE